KFRIVHRSYNSTHIESAAIFAHVPALIFGVSFFGRSFKFLTWNAGQAVFFRKYEVEWLAIHFFGGVPQSTLGSGVPLFDITVSLSPAAIPISILVFSSFTGSIFSASFSLDSRTSNDAISSTGAQ